MGNCQTTQTSGSTSITRDSRRSSSSSNVNGKGPRSRLLREENLHLIPGRIISNDGNSNSSIFTKQGRKGINQDAMIFWENFCGEGSIFCGVFDGHGPHGHLVARNVRDALPLKLLSFIPNPNVAATANHPANIRGCLRRGPRSGNGNQQRQHQLPLVPLSAWKEAFARSFKAMDKELRSHPTLDCFCSGTTAVTLLKLGSNLFMGNIGDSRAILGSKDAADGNTIVAVQLTVDLKPNLPREAERIKQCRGRVFAMQDEPEVPRVWLPFDDAPGLAMARAFGDFCLKDYGVISVPEFSHWTLTDKDQFVVLASDGVWDVLSNKEVVDIVASSLTRSSAAKLLIDAAAREWKLKYPTSKMDDCAVVCLFLNEEMDSESGIVEDSENAVCSADEMRGDAQSQEPTFDWNLTARSTGSKRSPVLVTESKTCCVSEDQSWSGLEGVTRVNSLVQLPRFSDENVTA